MKKLYLLLFLICACPAFALDNYAEGEVLVAIEAPAYEYYVKAGHSRNVYSEALSAAADSFADSAELDTLRTFPVISENSGGNIIHLRSKTKSTEQLMKELANDPRVKSVYPNYIKRVFAKTPNDPQYYRLWGMEKIRMPEVWEHATGSNGIIVAVLDTGIDYNHVDLKANMAVDSYGKPGRRFSEEGKVESDDPMDSYGHGTHVAGTIGAVGNNGIGVAGVNWSVKLLAVNVFPNGSGYDSDIIAGMEYILSEKRKGLNIRVANMSFGGWETPQSDSSPFGKALKALSDAGIICTMAAGNEYQNLNNPSGSYKGKRLYPACFSFANTITVGSIGRNNAKSSFSNYNSNWVHIAAPGESIYSTRPNNNYGEQRGTSMSSAHVAGVAALLSAAFPGETPAQIRGRILNNALGIGVENLYWKHGLLDAATAYDTSKKPESPDLPEPPDPPGPGSGSSGSGCNSGLILVALLLAIALPKSSYRP